MVSVELHHQATGICQREKVAFDKATIPHIVTGLKTLMGNAFVLSTCNRFSIYSSVEDPKPLIDFFVKHGVDARLLSVTRGASETAYKLFETASGLRSQFYGERQILSQIKEFYQIALKHQSLDKSLDLLVRSSIHAGKVVQKVTGLHRITYSMIDSVVEAVRNIVRKEQDQVVVFGTGSMAKLVVSGFLDKGLRRIVVVSRDRARLSLMEEKYGVEGVTLEELDSISNARVFVGATDQRIDLVLVGKEVLNGTCIVDLGMPRNFDDRVKEFEGVQYFNLDTLHKNVVEETAISTEVSNAKQLLDAEVERFKAALNKSALSNYAGAYWQKLQASTKDELNWLMPKLKDMDEEEKILLERYSHRLLRAISNDVMEYINSLAYSGYAQHDVDILDKVFNLKISNYRSNESNH